MTLTDDEGEVLAHVDIEEEFGDIGKSLPQALLLQFIVEQWRVSKAR